MVDGGKAGVIRMGKGQVSKYFDLSFSCRHLQSRSPYAGRELHIATRFCDCQICVRRTEGGTISPEQG